MREKLDELARLQEAAMAEKNYLAICAYRRALLRDGDALLEYVRGLEGEVARLRAVSPLVALADASLAARDAQQRREGAAQGIEQAREMLSMAESGEEADEMMREAVKRLRDKTS